MRGCFQSILSQSQTGILKPLCGLVFFVFFVAVLTGCDQHIVHSSQSLIAPLQVQPADGQKTGDAVLLEWEMDNSLVEFRIQVASQPNFDAPIVDDIVRYRPIYALSNLKLDGQYYWRVRTEIVEQYSEWSDVRQFQVDRHTESPSAPNLTTPDNGTLDLETSLRLEWEPVDGAYAYHLVVTIDQDMYMYQVDLENIEEPFFDIDGLILTYPYWWKVRALSPAGWSDWSAVWIFWIKDGV